MGRLGRLASRLARLARLARRVGWYVGAVMGDSHYRSYLDYRRRAHPGEPVLSERDYWRRRYHGEQGARCC